MSPEQVKNAKHTDLRTDIWALGAILYELIAGAPPFVGVSMVPKTADASAPRDVARAQSHPHGIAADPFDTPPRIYWLTDDALVCGRSLAEGRR